MSKTFTCALAVVVILAPAVDAQWSQAGTAIFYNGGNVGVGTNDPQTKLNVNSGAATDNGTAALRIGGSGNYPSLELGIRGAYDGIIRTYGNDLHVYAGHWRTVGATAAEDHTIAFYTSRIGSADWSIAKMLLDPYGNLGIATSNPQTKLNIASGASDSSGTAALRVGGAYNYASLELGIINNYDGMIRTYGNDLHIYAGHWRTTGSTATEDHRISFYTSKNGSNDWSVAKMVVDQNGNVGIGTPAPASRLHVMGDGVFSGTVTGGNIQAKYQDLAEWVPAKTDLRPGTVVVLDPEVSNSVMTSASAYDTTVAGVVSAQPGILLGESGQSKEQIATTGRVKVRVDATRAPIRIGDLLVTSDKPGMAMRSQPIDVGGVAIHRPGTVIGKALEPLAGGEGEILVLLSLQ